MDAPFLHLQDIDHRYGQQQVLHGVSLRLEAGTIGLLGPNGAGKSTLLRILLGLIRPTRGTGEILGHVLGRESRTLRRLLGYMPETDALVSGLRGADYVSLAGELYGMPRRQAQRRAHEVLSDLGLGEARYRKVEEYSLGMKQRLKLAQALVHDPPALLLDEPTSGLDPAGRQGMLDLLGVLARDHGKTILLSTHLLGDVHQVCRDIVILHQGRILRHGEVSRLCRRRQDRYRLRYQGDPNGWLEDLRLEGVQILADNGRDEVRVQVPPDWTTRAFFLLADHHGVVLREMTGDDEDLEELFHRVIEENAPG